MMDILQHLYKARNNMGKHHMPTEASLFGEAADTIESLSAELEAVKKERDMWKATSIRDAKRIDALAKERDELVARLIDSREALQEFRRRLYAVPSFGNKVNRATRESLSLAQSVILNLDAVGGPLDYPPFDGKPYEAALAKLGTDKTGEVG